MFKEIKGTTIRALCTDIDGTLLDARRELSVSTIETFSQIKSNIPIILASSRMPSAMRHLQRELGILQHPLICYNGGYVIRYNTQDEAEVIHSTFIPLDICAAILEGAKDTSVHVSLYCNDDWFAPKMDQWALREATITKVSPVIKSGEDVLRYWNNERTGAHKIMCMGPADEISMLEKSLVSTWGTQIHVYHSRDTYLEIAPKVISKGSALKLLLTTLYNIPLTDVMAFGDNYNDIALLQSVGWGIAVGNARPEVKAVARGITTDSRQDGVAAYIRQYVLDNHPGY